MVVRNIFKSMRKQTVGVIFLVTTVVIVGLIVWGNKQSDNLPASTSTGQSGIEQADITYYFGQECSHCQAVAKFIADNQIEQKVIFTKKEVWHNADNNKELQERAAECSLESDKVGVPFLFARGKCYIGETEVENFFKKEAGI